jgi:hypothetical protein
VTMGQRLRVWLWASVLFAGVVVVVGVAADAGIPAARALLGQPLPGLLRPAPAPAHGPARVAGIPDAYLRWYERAAGACAGLDWSVLAAVGKAESDHGRSPLPGVRSGANQAGAAGPMQLGVGGKAGPTWQHYRTDADHDGTASVYDPPDAITAAARKLCHDGARRGDVRGALWAYNPSATYVSRVLAQARRYAQEGGSP